MLLITKVMDWVVDSVAVFIIGWHIVFRSSSSSCLQYFQNKLLHWALTKYRQHLKVTFG